MRRRTLLGGLAVSAGALMTRPTWASGGGADGGATIRFDVRGAGLKPQPGGLVGRWGASGPGGKLTANNCYLEKDGKPLPIVAGEIHPQRVPVEEWEYAILQMKAAGLNTVSSYLFWNQIERTIGQFDFSGHNDLRRFFTLCQRHGMMVMLRIGPFTNAEFLLGGLPVWLYGLPTTERSNDPLYLKLVGRYYAALGEHLHGLMWAQGGPIAIVQLENELTVAPVEWNRPFLYGASASGHTGPTGTEFTDHYRKLHELAMAGGLQAPFYSVTGWGAQDPYPIDVVMPTFGGYMDLGPPGPSNHELTTFHSEAQQYDDKVPTGFIEIGYGSPARDTFRPRPPAVSGYTSTLTLLGASRSLMVGYYVFRGGSNPVDGVSGWTIKNAMFPLISYDFWAPISEYGEWREAFFRARPLNLFVQNYADELARAEPRAPERPVTDPDDDRARAEVRMDGDRGFVFLCNYGNVHPLSERKNFSLEFATDKGSVRIPHSTPIDLPSGTLAIWPINLDLGAGVTLRSATAQPVCRFIAHETHWHVFTQTGSVPVEFVFDRATVRQIRTRQKSGQVSSSDGFEIIRLAPGRGSILEIVANDGSKLALLLLSEQDAGKLAQLGSDTAPLLALSDAMVTCSDDTVSVASRDTDDLGVSFFPPVRHPGSRDGIFQRVALAQSKRTIPAQVQRLGDERALLKLAPSAFDGLDEIFLDIAYSGDVCRIFDAATGLLVADTMNNGVPWAVSLSRFRNALAGEGLLVRVEPALVGGDKVQLDGQMTLTSSQRAIGAPAALTALTFHPRYIGHIPLA